MPDLDRRDWERIVRWYDVAANEGEIDDSDTALVDRIVAALREAEQGEVR